MQAALDCAVPYVFERQQFGQYLGRFQMMQAKLADMYVALQSSRAYLYNSAASCDLGIADNKNCAAVLLMCSENAVKVSLEAIQCLGIKFTIFAKNRDVLRIRKMSKLNCRI